MSFETTSKLQDDSAALAVPDDVHYSKLKPVSSSDESSESSWSNLSADAYHPTIASIEEPLHSVVKPAFAGKEHRIDRIEKTDRNNRAEDHEVAWNNYIAYRFLATFKVDQKGPITIKDLLDYKKLLKSFGDNFRPEEQQLVDYIQKNFDRFASLNLKDGSVAIDRKDLGERANEARQDFLVLLIASKTDSLDQKFTSEERAAIQQSFHAEDAMDPKLAEALNAKLAARGLPLRVQLSSKSTDTGEYVSIGKLELLDGSGNSVDTVKLLGLLVR